MNGIDAYTRFMESYYFDDETAKKFEKINYYIKEIITIPKIYGDNNIDRIIINMATLRSSHRLLILDLIKDIIKLKEVTEEYEICAILLTLCVTIEEVYFS